MRTLGVAATPQIALVVDLDAHKVNLTHNPPRQVGYVIKGRLEITELTRTGLPPLG